MTRQSASIRSRIIGESVSRQIRLNVAKKAANSRRDFEGVGPQGLKFKSRLVHQPVWLFPNIRKSVSKSPRP